MAWQTAARTRETYLVPHQLERNIVVERIGHFAAADGCRPALLHRRGPPKAAARAALFPRLAAAIAAVEQSELAAEPLQHDLGGLALIAVFVGEFARLQLALNVNLRAFLAVLLGDLAEILVENHDIVPFGAVAPLAGRLVAPGLGRRQREGDDAVAGIQPAHFRIASEIAEEDDLVDAARHDAAPLYRRDLTRSSRLTRELPALDMRRPHNPQLVLCQLARVLIMF